MIYDNNNQEQLTLWYNKFILINNVKYDIYILYTSKFN
jgi:hypothetical protein